MILLHGTWVPQLDKNPEGFFLWGETSTPVATNAGQSKRRRTRKTGAQPHPFQASLADMTVVLTGLNGNTGQEIRKRGRKPASEVATGYRECETAFQFPSANKFPLPSPESMREDAFKTAEAISFMPWTVQGLLVSASQATSWLARLPSDSSMRTVGNGLLVRPARDLIFWSAAGRLALELLVRGRFVPWVSTAGPDGKAHGVWTPVLTDPADRQRLAMLESMMPGVCRSQCVDSVSATTPQALLTSFLQSVMDASVRELVKKSFGQWCAEGRQSRSLEVAWMASLLSAEVPVLAREGSLKRLIAGVRSWIADIVTEEQVACRTCFRLEPPEGDDDRQEADADQRWKLAFLLQSTEDPSLLFPASDVWRGTRKLKRAETLKPALLQERLVKDLGKAARLMPALDRSLQDSRPGSAVLTSHEAYDFLRETAWLLEDSGFGVLVPPWWKRGVGARRGLGIKARLRKPAGAQTGGVGGFGLESLVEYDWQLALGEETLTLDEFQRLAALKVPLIRVRGEWIELRPEQLDAALKFLAGRNDLSQMTLAEALRLQAGLEQSVTGLPVVKVDASGALAKLLGQLTGDKRLRSLTAPPGFNGSLRTYQEYGFSWLAFLRDFGIGGCLADDMGLGKTIQLLALLLRDQEQGKLGGPVLLVCPTSVVTNWQREADRFAPELRVHVHHGPDRERDDQLTETTAQHDLVITTYALAQRDEKDLQAISWQGIVLDEAQNIKNPSAKQTQALMKLSSQFRFCLTGTPVENRLTELWSLMQFLNPGYLGAQSEFRRRFAIPIERYQEEEASSRLRSLVKPFLLRRVKTDPAVIRDLPEKIETLVFCPLTREQATLYQAVVEDLLNTVDEVEGIQRKGQVLAAMSKLKQICNHPAQFLGDGSALKNRSGKLARLEEMFDELLAEGDRALLFTQFATMGELLKEHLQATFGREALFLHGGLAKKARDAMVTRFQSPEGPPLFILSLKAGGVGLNLTQANHVFHFDRWWNPAVENQATDRAFRIGQTRNVQVHKFVCQGTLEDRIQEMLEAKKALADSIVGTGENWLTELSTDELRRLLTLEDTAVEES